MLALLSLVLAGPHDLYQVSTYGVFASGKYEGSHQISELPRHGNFGLGTFNRLDGEMVVLDGVVNRITGFGDATQPAGQTGTPFAFVTHFEPEKTLRISHLTPKALQSVIDREYKDAEAIVAIRLDGKYSGLQARSFAPQPKPYLPLANILDRQSMFPYGDAAGTFVGFRMPKSAAPVNVPGYHFHYLSQDRKHGGHVLGYGDVTGTLRLMRVRRIVAL